MLCSGLTRISPIVAALTTMIVASLFVADSGAAELQRPRIEPEEIVAKVETWIQVTSNIRLGEYVLDGVSFDFVRGSWSVFYECKPGNARLGCHFAVTATNATVPEFTLQPGI
jgi:hypothetical protein